MSKLAINGGTPVCAELLPDQNTMGQLERLAVNRVMDNGRLSYYQGNCGPNYWGGPAIQSLEVAFKAKYGVTNVIPCNSASSGLQMCCIALGLKPGDEVIVGPFSMSISATAPMICGATPVFCDIERDHFCLDPDDVEKKITSNTKAIIAVSIFGQSYSKRIDDIAKKHGIIVINDNAQALGSIDDDGAHSVSRGHASISSCNHGKLINAGEGGIVITKYNDLAIKLRLVMNHADAVISDGQKCGNYSNEFMKNHKHLIGCNLRMTELQAAIAEAQLSRIEVFLTTRRANAEFLADRLDMIPAITACKPRGGHKHAYYAQAFIFDSDKANGLHRDRFIDAVNLELKPREGRENDGSGLGKGYVTPLSRMPIFGYDDGLVPVCEDLSYNKLFVSTLHAPNSTLSTMATVAECFEKVWGYRHELE
jgi:dTDP-4-amino-4,6-dideoxygalactose transaminase